MRTAFQMMALILALFISNELIAQKNTTTNNLVYVDKQGVLRYSKNNTEASFFGVNYTVPFAHSYRAHKALNIDLEKAIQQDVYHLARLGLDAFRVHVWDTEISDSAGNLIENEHLRLFDFLLAELKKRNIKTIITPIAFWGNGYPEKDEKIHKELLIGSRRQKHAERNRRNADVVTCSGPFSQKRNRGEHRQYRHEGRKTSAQRCAENRDRTCIGE